MKDLDVGSLPVGENDRLIGMVTDRDIACRGLADGKDVSRLTARDVMSKGIVYCTENDELEDAVHLMEKKKDSPFAGHQREEANGRHAGPRRYLACRLARYVRQNYSRRIGASCAVMRRRDPVKLSEEAAVKVEYDVFFLYCFARI
jgi:CBS domain-containing protein